MLQRLIALLLGVLGLASIGLGVASATAWRADDPLVASVTLPADQRLAVGDPGVLELAGDPVTVTVRADDSPVVLAVGRDTDVAGWVGEDAHVRLTGLSSWHALATSTVEAPEPAASAPAADDPTAQADPTAAESDAAAADPVDPAEAAVADPTGSDLWVTEVDGDGTASLTWPTQAGRWSLLVASLGDTAPTVELSWPRTVTTPWLWPGVVLGVLLLAAAAIMAIRLWRAAHEEDDPQWQVVTTGMIAVVPGPVGASDAHAGTPDAAAAPPLMTRRQLREAEVAAAAARRGRGGRTPTGTIPVVVPSTAPVPEVPSEAEPPVTSADPQRPASAAGAARTTASPSATPGGGAGTDTGRGTTVRPAASGPSGPGDEAAQGSGTSRADAWRRTWGIAEAGRASEETVPEGVGADPGASATPDATEPGTGPRKEDDR